MLARWKVGVNHTLMWLTFQLSATSHLLQLKFCATCPRQLNTCRNYMWHSQLQKIIYNFLKSHYMQIPYSSNSSSAWGGNVGPSINAQASFPTNT
jgi:hypothetical protein